MKDLVYNEIIATPGYELEFAVGSTYSLDAETFLAVALSFARLGDLTDGDFQSPFRLLEGLRHSNNRIALFCNRGGLQPPVRTSVLYAMLDKSVFEVADERVGRELANFHPKFWVIKERSLDNSGKRQIKLIILSRNLTKDSSLDIGLAMTAPLGVTTNAEIRRKHKPLKEILLKLADKANTEKRKKIRKLANEIDTLGRFELEAPYEDYDLLPIYFGENLNTGIDFRQELPGEKMAVVSPFIDSGTLSWLNGYRKGNEKLLITRLDSLTPEIMGLYSGDNREVWVMSQIAEQNDILPMNLHAKMYFSWGGIGGGINLWLGSANATRNGFYRNSEFLAKLKLKRGRNQFENFKAVFCDGQKQMCERITALPEMETEVEDNTLMVNVRKNLISRNNLTAQVLAVADEYIITIQAKRIIPISGKITLAPIQEPWNEAELTEVSRQCRIVLTDRTHLSEFYILKVETFDENAPKIKLVIKINTTGIPEDRDDGIFRSLIDTRDKFFNYVEMMITDRPQELASLMIQNKEPYKDPQLQRDSCKTAAIYESLLRIASTNPERLEDIDDLANRLDTKVVPDSFRQMAGIFKKSIKSLR